MSTFNSAFLLRFFLLGGVCLAPIARAITPAELSARLAQNDNVLVIDARPSTAYLDAHIPGAINVPAQMLPFRKLPLAKLVVLYGDGLGVLDEAQALSSIHVDSSVPVELLAGGFAGWLSETHVSTSTPGIKREQIQGITYDRLVAAAKGDVVLVDVRPPPTPASLLAQAKAKQALASATQPSSDVVSDFANKLGVPLVGNRQNTAAALIHAMSTAPTGAIKSTGPVLDGYDKAGKLLVLVADDEADADAVARQLRARGNFRFTILIGGTDAIRHEGKIGSGRMTGGTYAGQTAP